MARRTIVIWDILLPTEQEAKQLPGSVLTTRNPRLQKEYMGTRKTKITVHGVPVDISEDRMGTAFSKFGKVEEVKALLGKSGIATDVELQVTLTRTNPISCCAERRKCGS